MLEKLKAYKELIAIIVFSLGGFVWLQVQFPTRADLKIEQADLKSDIGMLNCLVEKYMTLTQLQIHARDLEREIQELSSQVSTFTNMPTNVALSPALGRELEGKKSEMSEKRKDLRTAADAMQKISDDLARNVCKKVAL